MWTYQHHSFRVHQIPALSDNYIYLIEDSHSDVVAIIDPAVAADVKSACKTLHLTPTHILNTHHHWDHTDANLELIAAYSVEVIGNISDANRIPGISRRINASESFHIGELHIQAIDVPGHTIGHIAFQIDDALFCGDTLFGAGCGRLFEGSYTQMWASLQNLAALKVDTKVYCAHEYTLPNLRFAREVDKNNDILKQRISHDTKTRMNQQPTIPSTIALELDTNPFLRPLNPVFLSEFNQKNKVNYSPLELFQHIRESKNTW